MNPHELLVQLLLDRADHDVKNEVMTNNSMGSVSIRAIEIILELTDIFVFAVWARGS